MSEGTHAGSRSSSARGGIGHDTGVQREFLFGDLRPFEQCHASTLVEIESGQIFAAWFGGRREGHRSVGIWGALRHADRAPADANPAPGAAWSEPRRLCKVSDEPHWNPVLYRLPRRSRDTPAPLVLQWKVGRSIRSWVTWIQTSLDEGKSWTRARTLVPGDRGARGAVRTKPIQLMGGDWIAGASTERMRRWDAFFDRSPDGQGDWRATEPVEVDRSHFSGKGLIQPTLWESEPGHVHALFRSTDGRAYRSDSADGGRRWSRAYPTDIPNNNSGLDLARLPNGTLALACNPVAGNWAARTPLSLLFSFDNGVSWPERIEIATGPGEFSYPALIPTGPQQCDLAITYTWNRRRIALARVPATCIPAPEG